MKLVALALLMCGCFMSPVYRFGGNSSQEAQQQTLSKLMPPLLTTDRSWTGTVRTAKIRVWADNDYRAQNVHWEHTFEEQLDYANEVLTQIFGIRLTAEYRVWDRGVPGSTLSDDLEALVQVDPGDDVFAVIGLASSLRLVSATFEELGRAQLPGRHLVVRGYADLEERASFERAFHDLRPDERESLLEARRRHKTTAILLHELGHNLGAPHEAESETIMNAIYSDHSAAFSDQARDLMLMALGARLDRSPRTTPVIAAPRAPAVQHVSLVISITATGATVVEGKLLDDAALDELLRATFAQDHATEVVVSTVRNAPHDAMIKLLDRATAAGLTRFSMAMP